MINNKCHTKGNPEVVGKVAITKSLENSKKKKKKKTFGSNFPNSEYSERLSRSI